MSDDVDVGLPADEREIEALAPIQAECFVAPLERARTWLDESGRENHSHQTQITIPERAINESTRLKGCLSERTFYKRTIVEFL